MHSPSDGVFVNALLSVVAGLLAVVEFPVTEGIGWEIVVFLGVFLDLDRSDPIIFCIGCWAILLGRGYWPRPGD